MNIILFILTNILKVFGLVWIAGGLFVCIKVFKSSQIDKYIRAINNNYPPDYKEYIFGFLIGLLTLLSGVTLLFYQDGALLFLGLLIITQWFFLTLEKKKLKPVKMILIKIIIPSMSKLIMLI